MERVLYKVIGAGVLVSASHLSCGFWGLFSFSEAPVSLSENLGSCSNDIGFSLAFSSNDELYLLVSFCEDNIKSLPSL